MILYLCEKPAQARDIAKQLKATKKYNGYLEGNGYRVTWCIGHLLKLAPPEYYRPDIKPWRIEKLPVIPDEWKYLVSEKTKKQFNVIKNLLKQTNHVVIASDPDREGECIVREILDYCHYQGKIERLWLNALDDVSIQKALKNIRPGRETEKLYFAGVARSRSDFVIGLNNTMALSSLYGVNSVLSAGRVQTPTLQLVVERDKLIEQFKPEDYYELHVLFSKNKEASFRAIWQAPEDVLDEAGHCLNQTLVEIMAAKVEGEPGIVKRFTETPKSQTAPLGFSLSALQKKASGLYGFSAKQVLTLAQSLYERHKAITYPRTDCPYLPESQFVESELVLNALKLVDPNLQAIISLCEIKLKSPIWNDKKITAHHAIIPTQNKHIAREKLSADEMKLYNLIRRQYIAQFLGEYEWLERQVDIVCASELFKASQHIPAKLGWKQAVERIHPNNTMHHEDKINDEASANMSETIPNLQTGDRLANQDTQFITKQTKPLPHFTEGTLIEAMKNVGKQVADESLRKTLKASQGIGTEATRANVLDILFKRDYLKRKGKQVISTPKGRALLAVAPNKLKDPILTAQWEQKLDEIIHGKLTFNEFIALQCEALHAMLKALKMENSKNQSAVLQLQSNTQNGKVYLCPKCEAPLRRLKNKKGKHFWGCSHYPACDFTTWEKYGKPHL